MSAHLSSFVSSMYIFETEPTGHARPQLCFVEREKSQRQVRRSNDSRAPKTRRKGVSRESSFQINNTARVRDRFERKHNS